MASLSVAQLVNQGGTITIQPGATLIVETDIDNQSGSTITNEGTIIVEEDFLNAGQLTSTSSTSKVIFRGDLASEMTSNGDSIYHLEFDKTAENVTLMDDAFVTSLVKFTTDGKFILGANDMTMGEVATVDGAGSARYMDASGTGLLKKDYTAPANYTFHVGDTDDYSPLSSVLSGGSYAAGATMGINVVDDTLDQNPVDATEFISRYWNVELEGITGATENTVTGTYVAADVQGGDETLINGTSYANGAFDYTNSSGDDVGNTVTSRIDGQSSADFTGTNKYGLLSLTMFLQGAMNPGNTAMTNAINSILPTTSPYDASVSVESIPASAVDWINIEVRDATDNTSVLTNSSAFVTTDGSVVGLSGSGDPMIKDAPASGFIAVKHRNHLGAMADASVNLDGTATIDLTNPATVTFGTDAQATVGAFRALIGGDVNGDGFVYYQGGGNDRDALLTLLAQNQFGFLQTYILGDVNLDSFTYYQGGGNDRDGILTILGQNQFGFLQQQLP